MAVNTSRMVRPFFRETYSETEPSRDVEVDGFVHVHKEPLREHEHVVRRGRADRGGPLEARPALDGNERPGGRDRGGSAAHGYRGYDVPLPRGRSCLRDVHCSVRRAGSGGDPVRPVVLAEETHRLPSFLLLRLPLADYLGAPALDGEFPGSAEGGVPRIHQLVASEIEGLVERDPGAVSGLAVRLPGSVVTRVDPLLLEVEPAGLVCQVAPLVRCGDDLRPGDDLAPVRYDLVEVQLVHLVPDLVDAQALLDGLLQDPAELVLRRRGDLDDLVPGAFSNDPAHEVEPEVRTDLLRDRRLPPSLRRGLRLPGVHGLRCRLLQVGQAGTVERRQDARALRLERSSDRLARKPLERLESAVILLCPVPRLDDDALLLVLGSSAGRLIRAESSGTEGGSSQTTGRRIPGPLDRRTVEVEPIHGRVLHRLHPEPRPRLVRRQDGAVDLLRHGVDVGLHLRPVDVHELPSVPMDVDALTPEELLVDGRLEDCL